MPGQPSAWEKVNELQLGDIVRLPDGRTLAIRACERQMATNVFDMRGWLLAGEIGPQSALLSIPNTPADTIRVFMPIEDVPASMGQTRKRVEGKVSYWSPHLPGISGAMGQLVYAVHTVRGANEVLVLVWRGNELVVYVESAEHAADAMHFIFLPRDAETTEQDVVRYGGIVRGPGQAAPPLEEPSRRPLRRLPSRRR